MRIAAVDIRGFRGIREAHVVLPRHALLLGPNNAGKSTIAEALGLLAQRDRLLRPLTEWDFTGGEPKDQDRFTIVATLTDFGVPDNDPTLRPDWFVGDRAARPVWWNSAACRLYTDSDCPQGAELAAQIAVSGRYDAEECAVETRHFFYDGDSDPFVEECATVPVQRLRELGVFLLPANREWDRLLGFGSSTFLKLLRQHDAVPGQVIGELKQHLREGLPTVESSPGLAALLRDANDELRTFGLIHAASELVYRPTSLDADGVMRALTAHIAGSGGELLPVAKHGSGMIALQAFLILLAFGKQRREHGGAFTFIAEEPELHLHPALHHRLALRVRGSGTQSLVTTQSASLAAAYPPTDTLFVSNRDGILTATPLRQESVSAVKTNAVRKLYLWNRREFYDALMGTGVLVPEGKTDAHWMALWQRFALASDAEESPFMGFSVIPTEDASIVDTYWEVAKFRPDAVPIVDGDKEGQRYLERLLALSVPPKRVIALPENAAIECACAWILEPALAAPKPTLASLLGGAYTPKALFSALCKVKADPVVREELAWEASESPACSIRASGLCHDISLIVSGGLPRTGGWRTEQPSANTTVFIAGHMVRP